MSLRPCVVCGQPTGAPYGICVPCQIYDDDPLTEPIAEPDVTTEEAQ